MKRAEEETDDRRTFRHIYLLCTSRKDHIEARSGTVQPILFVL